MSERWAGLPILTCRWCGRTLDYDKDDWGFVAHQSPECDECYLKRFNAAFPDAATDRRTRDHE